MDLPAGSRCLLARPLAGKVEMSRLQQEAAPPAEVARHQFQLERHWHHTTRWAVPWALLAAAVTLVGLWSLQRAQMASQLLAE